MHSNRHTLKQLLSTYFVLICGLFVVLQQAKTADSNIVENDTLTAVSWNSLRADGQSGTKTAVAFVVNSVTELARQVPIYSSPIGRSVFEAPISLHLGVSTAPRSPPVV